MDGKELLKWGLIIVAGLFALRFVSGMFSGMGDTVQQTSGWPGPYGIGGGVIYGQPYPVGAYWGPRTSPGTGHGHGHNRNWNGR